MNKQTTNNIKAVNKDIEIVKKHFSYCFDKNGNFDLEKFKNELSKHEIDFSNESYGMDWLGKSYARLLASDEATTLLKEDKKWNDQPQNTNSQNLLVKGDNLEVLKHLSNAYYEKVKMIYIDPPYNTGSDGFVYQDDRKFTVDEFRKLAGVDEEKARRILDFVDSKSNSHSAWLTFMYPRLYIAKQLLTDDGVIFISIDDNELAQLKILMDEVFGEENFVGIFTVENNPKGRKNSKFISVSNDFCLVYARSTENADFKNVVPKPASDMEEDENGNFVRRSGKRVLMGENSLNPFVKDFKTGKHYSAYFNSTTNDFLVLKENSFDEIDKKLIDSGYKRYISFNGDQFTENTYSAGQMLEMYKARKLDIRDNKIYEKHYSDKIQIKSVLTNTKYAAIIDNNKVIYTLDLKTTSAKQDLTMLMGENVFDFPKNTSFVKTLIELNTDEKSIVLDFFAGSGTTADAVMQLNADDDGSRKYILVQLPEEIDENKDKVAYDFVKNKLGIEQPTIFDITKERLIRAGKKIQKDIESLKEPKNLSNVDFGFKVFETTPIWDGYDIIAENFDSQMELFNENKLSDEDLQTLLTTWKTHDGVPLTQNAVTIDLDGYMAFYLDTRLYLMNKGFVTKNLKKILDEIDVNNDFNPRTVIAFGYNFESKMLRELEENIKNYANKKEIEIDFIARY